MHNKDNFYIVLAAIPAALVIGIGVGIAYSKYGYIKQKSLLLEKAQAKIVDSFNEKEKKFAINLEVFKQKLENQCSSDIKDIKKQLEEESQISTNKFSVLFHKFVTLGLEQLATQVEITGADENQHLEVKFQLLQEAQECAKNLDLLQQVKFISEELQKIKNAKQIAGECSSLMIECVDDESFLNVSTELMGLMNECSSLMIEDLGENPDSDSEQNLEFSLTDLVNQEGLIEESANSDISPETGLCLAGTAVETS